VILRCLEVDPEKRHATAGQLAFDLSHPDQVALTERAHRASRAPLGTAMKRWLATQLKRPEAPRPVAGHLAAAPIVMAAVDLALEMHELAEALRTIVRRVLEIEPKARLACVNVLKVPRVGIDFGEDAEGRSLHVRRLVALKHWARPLGLGEGRVTYTVLESPDPADALLDYARQAHVDHIVIGARTSSAMRRYLGSVSSQVVAEAPCNVTVVRTRVAGQPLPKGESSPRSGPGEGALYPDRP
jgi:nucleotide-binding universal stress UspA family protein